MGKAKRFNTYDSSVAESRKLVQSYGQIRQSQSTGSFRSPPRLPPIATTTAPTPQTPGSPGGTTFPVSYPVDDKGPSAVSGTITHSVTATTAHKLQFTANGDCDITITGFGSGNTNAVDFYIEVTQDGTGGHAITVNDAEWINFPTISTTADTTSLISAHADGDGNLRAVTLLNASPSSGNFATKQLDNLSTPVLNTDLSFGGNDATSIDRIQMTGGTPSVTSVNDIVLYVTSTGDLVSNINTGDAWTWSSSNVSKMILTESTLEKRDVVAPTIQLYNTRAAQTGTAGTFGILANTTATSTGVTMGFITSNTENIAADGTGSLKFGVRVSGVATNYLTLNNASDGVIKALKVLNMNTNKITNVVDPTLAQDAATKAYVDAGVGSVLTTKGDLLGFDTATTRIPVGVNGQHLEADSTQALGVKWSTPSGSQTPWLSNIDAASFVLDNVSRINQDGTVPTSGFLNMANSAGLSWEASPAGTDGTLTYNVSERFIFTSSASSAVIGAGGMSLGITGTRWGTLWVDAIECTNTLSVEGNTTIGNAATDTLTVNADISSHLIPNNSTRDIGALTTQWRNIFIDGKAHIDGIENDGTSIDIDDDLNFTGVAVCDFGATSSSSSGSAGTLPSNVEGYISIKVNGVTRAIPFYPT